MRLIRLRFNYDSFYFPHHDPQPTHSTLPSTPSRATERKEGPALYAWEPPGRHFVSILLLSSSPDCSYTQAVHTCTERGKENHSATSVLPFSSTVMNRELCKRWANLRTRKLDGQSGGPSLVCLKTAYRAYQINSYQKGQRPCFIDNDHSTRN